MFSSVLDKVVSATAPGTLATFPPRADLPASSSTLCCLSFVDRFISRYPTAYNTGVEDDIDGRLLLGHAGRSTGIAISTDDLESTMESAAELGGRLAAALAGTVRSKRREPPMAPVSDLLAKVRGIFGNRLTCVGREIRVSRNVQAERDETLLLRQIHALKNAALDASNGEKWSIVVSSGGESLAVCSVPLPAVEEGGARGCDFLIFDPSPRPAMKLRGSYVVKFTTVRGLQLHLLSALGEIWRGGDLPQEDGSKKEFVGLSVVMAAKGKGEVQVSVDSRRLLEDSVTSLRKAEKAAAIKIKREEVEALRRALKKPGGQRQLVHTTPSSGGEFGLTDGAAELLQRSKDNDLRSGSACSSHRGAQSYRQLELPKEVTNPSSTYDVGTASPCDGYVEQMNLNSEAIVRNCVAERMLNTSGSSAPHARLKGEESRGHHREVSDSRDSSGDQEKLRPPVADADFKPLKRQSEEITRNTSAELAKKSSDSTAPQLELEGDQALQDHHQEVSSSRDSSGGRPKLRPPVVDVSPPLSVRRSEREEGRCCWSGDGDRDPADRGIRPDLDWTRGTVVEGRVVGASTPGAKEVEPLASGRKYNSGVEGLERGSGHGGVDESTYPPSHPADEGVISDNPLHRALLRSIEGEGLAEYSKRAYCVYRTHGVIQDESEPDERRQPGPTSHNLSLSANQLHCPPAIFPPAGQMGMVTSPTIPSYGTSRNMIGPDGVSMGKAGEEECGLVGVGVSEPVRPFSPPPASPLTLEQSGGERPSSGCAKRRAEAATPASDQGLRVIDLSEPGDVLLSTPNKPASPPEGFRSKLRAPRAGRSLALASANARGNPGYRREGRSPGFHRRDVSAGRQGFPSSPPAMVCDAVPTRPKEAWIKEGQQQHDRHARKDEKSKSEFFHSRSSGGIAAIFSDDDDDDDDDDDGDGDGDGDGILERNGPVKKKAVAPREARPGESRPSHQPEKSKQARQDRNHLASGLGVHVGDDMGRVSHQGKSSNKLDSGRRENAEEISAGERAYEVKTSKEEWSAYRSGAVDGCIPSSTPAPDNSPPQRKANTSPMVKTHRKRGDDVHVQSQVECLENVPGRGSPVNIVLAEPPLLDSGDAELHRSMKNLKPTEDGESGETDKPRDNGEFMWFGQPDTPSNREPAEDVEATRRAVKEIEAAGGQAGVRTAAELQFDQQRSPPPCRQEQQQHLSKAQLVLQMEVRRQRDIIEQAFRAREEEGRLRKARIRAEVLRRIQGLIHRRSSSPSESIAALPSNARSAQQLPHDKKPEPPNTTDQARQPPPRAHRAAQMTAASPPHPETDVKAWGFGPAIVHRRATHTRTSTVKAVQPEVPPVPDVAPSERETTFVDIKKSAGDTLASEESKPKHPPNEVAAAENPWGRVTSRTPAGLEGGIPAKAEPTPPPISFDVEASEFRDGAGWLDDGGTCQEQEKARRQARYEALRARKMAEAEERKRSQRERQAAARVEQRKKTAVAAAVTAGEEQYGQENTKKNGLRRQSSAQHGSTVTDAPSQRNKTSGTSTARPRSSSQPTNEDRLDATQVVSALGDSNGGSGGGGTRLSTPISGRLASPVVRGFSRRSNRKLVRNAINFLCLAGGHLEEKKSRALEALDSHPGSNFVVLLAHTKLLSFKGLYACSVEEDGIADRVFGLGPPQIDATVASGFYKYNSAAREFREVHSKTLGKTTDAISMEPARLKRPKGLAMQ